MRRTPRPQYNTSVERKRRAATVAAFLAEHGFPLASGDVAAEVPKCRQVKASWVADRVRIAGQRRQRGRRAHRSLWSLQREARRQQDRDAGDGGRRGNFHRGASARADDFVLSTDGGTLILRDEKRLRALDPTCKTEPSQGRPRQHAFSHQRID